MAVMEDPVWNSAGYECLCDGDYFDWLLTCLLYDWYVLNSFIFPGMCYVSKFRRRSKCEACRPASVHSHNTHSAPMNAFFIVCLLLNLLWLQSVSTQVTLFVSLIHPPVYLLNDIFSELPGVVLIFSGYCTLRALVTQAMHPSLVQFFQVIPNMVRKSSRVIVAAASRRPSSR